ncbi:MAG TPA: RimK family alpha-L-glutamate ligase [Polyangiaceae bacterium]|nr:RimK family alpha-L-glutamate ligase [Polyangiaceae bacterium]
MKVAILSCNPSAYSTRRLREVCQARGHRAVVLDTLRFGLLVDAQRPQLFYKNQPLSRYDAAIPRIGASITSFGCAVVRQLEQLGVVTLNRAQAIAFARDKLQSLQMLSRNGIAIPPTAFARDRMSVLPSIDLVGGAPVIIKLLEGTQGVGVILAENPSIAEAIVQTLQLARQNVIIQKFVRESRGRDLRAFVVDGKVVAAVSRSATGDEFRSNVHRGGRTAKVELDVSLEHTAVSAAKVMGLEVAGVDMVESDDGPQVLEVNSSPGLEGIEQASGIDVASFVIERLERLHHDRKTTVPPAPPVMRPRE